jgi:beta-lactamase regulating signal transducer with metallopeptidase domain
LNFYQVIADWSNWGWPLLANHLWQATLFSLLAFGAAALLTRAPARARYFVWLVAMTKFALPSALLFFLAAGTGLDPHSLPLRELRAESGALAVSPLLSPVTHTSPSPLSAEQAARETGPSDSTKAEPSRGGGGRVSGLLACLWLAGCAVLALSWFRKSRGLSSLLKKGVEVTSGREAEALRRVRSWFGMRRSVRLIVTPAVSEPGVWGVWRPVVVLPEGVSEGLDDDELEAVFMHELSHIERWDNLAGNFQRALCCVFWFHPVVWMIDRRLLAEREQACDDLVVRRGGANEVYANGIAKVCRYCMGWEVAGLAKVTGSDIKKRVERIITRRAGQRMSLPQATILAALSVGALTISLAAGAGNMPDRRPLTGGVGAAATAIDTRFEITNAAAREEAGNAPAQTPLHGVARREEAVTGRPSTKDVTAPAAPTDKAPPPVETAATTESVESQPDQSAAHAAPTVAHIPPPEEPPAPHDGEIKAAVVHASDVSYGDHRRFIGRYEVDPKRAENFVLDITLEGGELWLKPSHSRKRRLIRRSEFDFSDSFNDYDITAVLDERDHVVGLLLNSWGRGVMARKLMLPAPSLRGNVTFRLSGFRDARVVAVAGDFNHWNQSQFLFSREGDEWVCRVSLPAGTYQYKFIVDGNWLTDPNNPKTVHDRRGIENSIIRTE